MHRRLCLSVLLSAAALATAADAADVLLVIQSSTINASESARKSQFEGWGHTVTTIVDSSSQASFDTAVAAVDVVYVPGTITDWELLYKLRTAACGVVTETPGLDTEFGFATSDGYTANETRINVADNTHDVSTGLSTGLVTIFTSQQPVALNGNTTAAGMQVLARDYWNSQLSLGAIDTGGTLANTYNGNSTASGRRVRLPWWNISWSALNSNGLLIARQAIQWAAGDIDQLVAHWRLDETSGTTIADASGNGNTATVTTGSASWTSGIRSGAIEFDGTNLATTNSNFDPPADGTVAFWFRGNGTPASTQRLFGILTNWEVILTTTGQLGFDLGNGSGPLSGVVFDEAGVWRHVAFKYSTTSGDYSIYIDGELVDSGTYSFTDRPPGVLTLGSSTWSSSERFVGAIDDLRVYNYELTDDEIVTLYGLMGHWKLDESSGTTAADSSPMANDGAYENGVGLDVDGPYPGVTAADFDGADDDVTVPNEDLYDGVTEEVTIAMWFRVDAFDLNYQTLIAKGDTAWRLSRYGTTGALHFGVNSNSTGKLNSAVDVDDGQWHHVAATYDGAAMKLYVDGRLDSTKATTDAIATNDYAIQIGANQQTTGRNFEGAMHDVRLYSRALNEWEIAELYGLVGHWRLDEPSGVTAADSSLVGNDGDYTNGPTLAAPGPYPGAGANAADFDGFDDYVSVPNESQYDITEAITVAAWVKVDAFTAQWPTIACKGDYAWRLSRGQSPNENALHFACDGLTVPYAYGTIDVNDGEWHHVVGVYDGSSISLYIDGQLDVAHASTGTIDANDHQVRIGDNAQYTNRRWDGSIHDVRLYNRPLSQAEIAELYGLVAHWKLDEESGSTAYDSSGMGNDALLTGTQGWAEGQLDGGFSFNYTNGEEYFTAPSNNTLDDLQEGDYSVTAFFKPNSVPPGAGSDNDSTYGILMKAGWHTGLGFNYDAELQMEDWLTGDVWNGAGAWEPFPTGKFYHVAGVVSRAEGTVKIYVDGILKETANFTPGTASRDFGSTPWRIGVGEPGGVAWGYPCDGVIDDARLYNRALSADEVSVLHQSGQPTGLRIIRWVEAR